MCKFKKIILCVLSLVILLSAFPSTVYAKSYNVVGHSLSFEDKANGDTARVSGDYPLSVRTTLYTQNDIDFFSTLFSGFQCSDHDTVTIKIVFNGGGSFRTQSFSKIVVSMYILSEGTSYFFVDEYVNSFDYNSSTGTLTFNVDIGSVPNIDGVFYASVSGYPETTTSGTADAWYKISSVSVDVNSEQSGFFNKVSNFFSDLFSRLTSWFDNLFQWLKDIRDGNISFSESVKTLFSNITDNIRNFFNDLGNKLRDGIDNVGQWFSDIGDRISGFFSDLWNNISIKIESIIDSVSDWWQSVKDFFHSLFVPEDGYFDTYKDNWESWAKAHFGFFYDATELVDNLISKLNLKTPSNVSTTRITIPQIKLPFFDNPVIVPAKIFVLKRDLINQHSQLTWVYNTYQLVVTALSFFFIIKFAINTFNQVIGERE